MAGHEHGTFDGLPGDEVYAGVRRRAFSSQGATVTAYAFAPGASFPIHRHPSEQVTVVEDGEVHLTVAGETTSLGAGGWSVIAPGVEHGITAGDAGARFLAIVTPRREHPGAYEVVSP